MKIIYSFFLLGIIVFSSCSKLDPENIIAGNWKLNDVVKKRLFNNDHLITGYEAGLFTFYENGTAAYTDSITMTGNWKMHYEDRSYYDANGDYQPKNSLVLRLKLFNFSGNRQIDWEFDETLFKRSNNVLDGFIYSASYYYQYSFRRQ